MPIPNMMTPSNKTVCGTAQRKALGMKYAQMTTRKTIYVKFFPTKPLNFSMKSIIVTHILSKIRPDKYKYANGFDGAKKNFASKKRQSIHSAVPLSLS